MVILGASDLIVDVCPKLCDEIMEAKRTTFLKKID
jgi:hypothetical protein